MPDYPRDQVTSNDVEPIQEFGQVRSKLKAGQKVTPKELDEAIADYRAQLNAKWLPVINGLRAEQKRQADDLTSLRALIGELAKGLK